MADITGKPTTMFDMNANEFDDEHDEEREYLVKAAMLVQIHKQVTWPDSLDTTVDRQGRKQVSICVLGKNPFSTRAQEVFTLASSGGVQYNFVVRDTLKKQFCHILFIAKDKRHDVDAILTKLGSTPTLTISDISGFANEGGDIEFFLYANRVIKMLINERSALEKGLVYGNGIRNERVARFVHKRC